MCLITSEERKNPMDLSFSLNLFSLIFLCINVHQLLAFKQKGPKFYDDDDDHSASSLIDDCSDNIIDRREGNITSPNYPNKYLNHLSCTWHISGGIGEVVTIKFQDLDIEESKEMSCDSFPCCTFNWLKIGPSFNGTEQQYCGQGAYYHRTFVSTTHKAWIKFHISYVKNPGRGFWLTFSVGPREYRPCGKDNFQCRNHECIPQDLRCNGVSDCIDGSDEMYCSAYCPTHFSCRSLLFCYDEKKNCDGIKDCPDFSDEMGCGVCFENQTRCGEDSDHCYDPFTQRCNRIKDCLNGADEKDCVHSCPGKIVCSSGIGCYLPDERCNGIAQCSDSSDEKNCGPDLCNYERGGFLCQNGHCIREMWKCDHTNDCGDGTDEYNCLRNSVLTAAIMGSLICALLLIIAISCTCRLYALRALENRMNSNRESSLSRLSPEFIFPEPPPSYAVAVGEHQRNLYVENVHYNNAGVRRGRRRTRRARRYIDPRRGSVDPMVHQNRPLPAPPYNFPFPCLPVVTLLASNRSPSPETSQTNSSSATCISVVSSSETESQEFDQNNRRCSANISVVNVIPGTHLNPDKSKQSCDQALSSNAESSFNDLSQEAGKDRDGSKEESHPIPNAILTVDNGSMASSPIILSMSHPDAYALNTISIGQPNVHTIEDPVVINPCDNDTQPLIA